MFKLAYTLGCYEALVKLGATVVMPELTPAQKAYMERLTGKGAPAPTVPAEARALRRYLGSPLEQSSGMPAALEARSRQLGHAVVQKPGIPELPQWAHPRTGAAGFGAQPIPMAYEPTQVGTAPKPAPTGTEATQRLTSKQLAELERLERRGTKVIPRETMQELVFGKKPPLRVTPPPTILQRAGKFLRRVTPALRI